MLARSSLTPSSRKEYTVEIAAYPPLLGAASIHDTRAPTRPGILADMEDTESDEYSMVRPEPLPAAAADVLIDLDLDELRAFMARPAHSRHVEPQEPHELPFAHRRIERASIV